MICGRGDIASAINDRNECLFYCNGSSNRLPLNTEKEEQEILNMCKTIRMFVYISTLSIYYSESQYTRHKLKMENLVKINARNYCIFRIGNITWGNNPNTLINHLKKDTERVEETFRYIIKQGEFNHWIGMIPVKGKHEMNVTGQMLKVKDIVKYIQQEAL